jgi:hypothetical protein
MPALLKELPPRAVASLFQEIGVADAGVLMAMMPTRSLLLAFDESIWKSARPGLAETIGVRELVEWFIAWNDIGEQFLVEKLAAMSEDYLTTVLSHVVKVESASRYAVYFEDPEAFVKLCEDDRERIGPYIVEPVVDEDEDVVMELVRALWGADAGKVLRVFDRLTDIADPVDSTRGSASTSHDIESERESHREAQGFVTADGARAFFAFAERLTAPEIIALDEYDAETRRYLYAIERGHSEFQAVSSLRGGEILNVHISPVIADDFEGDHSGRKISAATGLAMGEQNTEPLRLLLEDAQLLERPNSSPLLLGSGDTQNFDDEIQNVPIPLTVELRRLAGEDIERFHTRARELGYLANVLRWVPNDVNALNDSDAKDAAFAICNLGLKLAANTCAVDLKAEPGLIRLFILGWNALSSIRGRVIGAFAGALSQQSTLAPWLQSEATAGLSDLRRAVESKRFEEAREAALFLSIVFDSRVCHAIAPLLAAIPRFSTLLEGAQNSHQARWITTKAELQTLTRLLDSLRLKSGKRGT